MSPIAITAAAFLIVGISFDDSHRSIDAIEYPKGIADCMRSLAGMKAQIAQRSYSEKSRLTFPPYCTQDKPGWWK